MLIGSAIDLAGSPRAGMRGEGEHSALPTRGSRVKISSLRPLLAYLLAAGVAAASPLVVGHRGAGAGGPDNPYPENTLPSIEAAFDAGADLVEVDVQLDRDGVPVLWHDATVPMRGGDVPVDSLGWAELPEVQAPGGMRAPVPRLEDVLPVALARAPGRRVLDIELKVTDPAGREALVEAVASVLRQARAAHRVLITSFDVEALRLVERELPGVESGLLGVFRGATLRTARGLRQAGAHVEWIIPSRFSSPFVGKRFVASAHAEGFLVGAWTVNRAGRIRRRIEAGYDMIITDLPGRARGLVDVLEEPPL